MSYARFGSSGIYIYDDFEHGVICAWCSLTPDAPYFAANGSLAAMLAHVAEHRAAGENIAPGVEQTLREEWDAE